MAVFKNHEARLETRENVHLAHADLRNLILINTGETRTELNHLDQHHDVEYSVKRNGPCF